MDLLEVCHSVREVFMPSPVCHMHETLHALVPCFLSMDSSVLPKSLWTQKLVSCFREFNQICSFGALGVKCELMTFWFKGQGCDATKCGPERQIHWFLSSSARHDCRHPCRMLVMYCQLGNILCIWMSVEATVSCSFLHEVKRIPTFLQITFARFISYNSSCNNHSQTSDSAPVSQCR